jgi:hypothetical protein
MSPILNPAIELDPKTVPSTSHPKNLFTVFCLYLLINQLHGSTVKRVQNRQHQSPLLYPISGARNILIRESFPYCNNLFVSCMLLWAKRREWNIICQCLKAKCPSEYLTIARDVRLL